MLPFFGEFLYIQEKGFLTVRKPIVKSSSWIPLVQEGNQPDNSALTATLNKVAILGNVKEDLKTNFLEKYKKKFIQTNLDMLQTQCFASWQDCGEFQQEQR